LQPSSFTFREQEILIQEYDIEERRKKERKKERKKTVINQTKQNLVTIFTFHNHACIHTLPNQIIK
jgi:hypothetical protein